MEAQNKTYGENVNLNKFRKNNIVHKLLYDKFGL